MKRALAIVAGGVLLCAIPYLAWLNPVSVDVHLAPRYVLPSMQLGVVLVGAFLAGAAAIMVGLGVRSAGAWLRGQWHGRRGRRDARAQAMEQRGRALLWAGKSDDGRAVLIRAWRRDPSRGRAVLAAATSYLDDGDAAAAERVLANALEEHRTDGELLLALSEACARQGNHLGAIQALEQLRAQHPHAPRVLIALRDRYEATARWGEAAAVQKVYLRTLNQAAMIARERARLLGLEYEDALARPNPSEQLHALAILVDANPGFVPAVVSLGDALVASGRADEAVTLWERTLRQSPRSVLVERLVRHDPAPPSRQHWRQTLRRLRAPQVRGDAMQLWLARLPLIDGRPSDALSEIDAVDAGLRATPFARGLRAEALHALGRLDQALREYAALVSDGAGAAHICRTCGGGAPQWSGRCSQCASWDTQRAAVEIAAE
ncbi:MAG TPA: tetratricopeptide repeat protein [Candidatus Binatia bacterium]|nr:tetratricopeptide repeat protein [Candidatus Binatia bacterium]